MRVHHLNCISACALGGRPMDGRTPSLLKRAPLCCHCLLLQTSAGLVLVDTGYGLRDVRDPKGRLSGFFLWLMDPDLREEMTAVRQIRRLGLDPADVRHIVLTHLDFDHAGGLDDFPGAQIHMLAQERDKALAQRSWLDRQRYRPPQWSTRQHWQTCAPGQGERWMGLNACATRRACRLKFCWCPCAATRLATPGWRCNRTRAGCCRRAMRIFITARWTPAPPAARRACAPTRCSWEKDRAARLANQARLRALTKEQAGRLKVCCAHDNTEFEQLADRPMSTLPPLRTQAGAPQAAAPAGTIEDFRS